MSTFNLSAYLAQAQPLLYLDYTHGPMVAWSPNPADIPEEYRIGGYEIRCLQGEVEFMKISPNKWVYIPELYNGVVFLQDHERIPNSESDLMDMLVMKAVLGYFFDSRVKLVLASEDHPIDIEDIWGYLANDNFVTDPLNNRYNPIDLTEESILDDDDSVFYSDDDMSTITEPTTGYQLSEDDTDAFFSEV